MGWDGCEGGPGTDLGGLAWNGRSRISMEGLGWVRRAWNWGGGPTLGVKGILRGPRTAMER